jgi:hypothetical protein
MWEKKSNVTGGVRDDLWIGTWLDSFVKTHGAEKVSNVLGDSYILP